MTVTVIIKDKSELERFKKWIKRKKVECRIVGFKNGKYIAFLEVYT